MTVICYVHAWQCWAYYAHAVTNTTCLNCSLMLCWACDAHYHFQNHPCICHSTLALSYTPHEQALADIVWCLANRNSIQIHCIHIRICPSSIGQADKGQNWWTPSFHRAQPDFSTTVAFLALHKYRDCNTVLPHDFVAIISTGGAWTCSKRKCLRPWHMLTKLLGSLSYSSCAGSSMLVRPKEDKLLRFGNKLLQVYLYLIDSKKLWLEIREAINSYSVVIWQLLKRCCRSPLRISKHKFQ